MRCRRFLKKTPSFSLVMIVVCCSVKRSDATGNRFEWELGENKVI